MKRTLLTLFVFTAFMMSSVSTMFAKTNAVTDVWSPWPPASDYTVLEWYVGMGHIDYLQIVYFQGGFYQCTAEDGTDSWSEGWNPTAWEAPHYNKVAEGRLWEVNMSHINYLEYVIYGTGENAAVYQCTAEDGTDAWSDGWSPTGWNATSYKKICDIVLVPVEENPLPANYVGYWYDNDLSWLPGWIAIDALDIVDTETGEVVHAASHLVYKCVAKTTPNGGEYPGSAFGHWEHDEPWNTPPTPMGKEKDLLSMAGVSIPAWDDDRKWPRGAIVSHEGKYYTCIAEAYTDKGGNQVPGVATDVWADLSLYNSIKNVSVEQLGYTVQNGRLFVIYPANVKIQVYNITGQLLTETTAKSVNLPQRGVYIAKINAGGKTTTVKVLR